MASCMVMMATTQAMANRVEWTPSIRPVATTMAQTVALWALGIPPSPTIRSSCSLPARSELMVVLISCAVSHPRMETVRISFQVKML